MVAEGRDFCSVFHVRFLHKISGVSFFAFSTLFYWILTVAHCFFPLFRQISLYQFDLSSDDERTGESVSIENQREMLSLYVREQGWNLYDTYCDESIILGLSQEVLAPQGFPGLVLIFIAPGQAGHIGG